MNKIIAISATSSTEQAGPRIRLSLNYVRSVEGAGLVPIIVPPLARPTDAAVILKAAGGLLLTGGEDVDSTLYGAPAHAAAGAPNKDRDATELALLDFARAEKIPVLAVCRGIQILNVFLGGTLIQDLPTERPSEVNHDPKNERGDRTHSITIAAHSKLAAATNATEMQVNSYHHQAVDRLANGIHVTATSPDGVIEAVESDDPTWWCVAVQWHPEDLTNDAKSWDRGIFKAFADAVRGITP